MCGRSVWTIAATSAMVLACAGAEVEPVTTVVVDEVVDDVVDEVVDEVEVPPLPSAGAPPSLRTEYQDVWSTGAHAWVVGLEGTILHWDGERWYCASPQWAGGLSEIHAVWGLSPEDVWVAGTVYPQDIGLDGQALVGHWDGQSWTPTTVGPGGLSDLWGSAPDDVWAVGWKDLAVHWDGSQWEASSTTPEPPRQWTTDNPPPSFTLFGTSGTAADDIWAVGLATSAPHVVMHWDGSEWSPVAVPDPEGTTTVAVWASARDDVWIAGRDVILHWDGEHLVDAGSQAAAKARNCARHPERCAEASR